MAEKIALGEEIATHQGGEQADRVVAEMEAVVVVERLEVVEIAVAEEARLIAVAAGILSASSLLKIINEKRLKTAEDQNPLTGLPGNHAIRDFMRDCGRDGDEERYFCYCDFDNFKPFNDHYGFHLGDHAISLFAALLRRYFFSEGDFLGHVGGDDFFIGVSDWTETELVEILDRLLSDFHEDVTALYSDADRLNGHIRGHDRSGVERDFALMRCSIGVLRLPKGLVLDDVNRVSARIAEVKKQAKDSATGLVVRAFAELG